jgi:trans-aconitate methyltransferase
MDFQNVYEDAERAASYARLEYPGTYYLAFRDLPEIISTHVQGRKAIDFGCGAGRSTRFLQSLGFAAIGLDISADMIRKAREMDPRGDYRLIPDGDFSPCPKGSYDLVFSAFTFDNIPTLERKVRLFAGLGSLLSPEGGIVSLVSSPEIYTHEWASFSTRDFPENREARSGDRVKIIMTDVEDKRPVEDVLWTDESYQEVYRQAGLENIQTHKPLARENEPYPWVNETEIAPWVIYVLGRKHEA